MFGGGVKSPFSFYGGNMRYFFHIISHMLPLLMLIFLGCGGRKECKSLYSSWKNPRLSVNFHGLSQGSNMMLQVVEEDNNVYYCNYKVSITEREIEVYYLYGDSSEICRKYNHKWKYSLDCDVLYLTENNQTETLF